MADDYQRHLAGLHARLQTPDAVILAALSELSPAPIESRRRIVEGEANEAHPFRLADGLELVMRIARNARGFRTRRSGRENPARAQRPMKECSNRETMVRKKPQWVLCGEA